MRNMNNPISCRQRLTLQPHRNARTRYLRRCGHQCRSRSYSLQGGLSCLYSLYHTAHRTAISSSTSLISALDSLHGRSPVNAERLDLTCILHPRRRRPPLKVMMETGCLREAPEARRNRLDDQQNLALRRISTYSN